MRRILAALTGLIYISIIGACTRPPESQVGEGVTPGTPGGISAVKVVALEYAFIPGELTVTAGQVTFQIKNEGAQEHEFEIFRGLELGGHADLVDEVEGIAPGMTRELKVDLGPGQYAFACMLPGHSEQGQRGIINVT